MQQQITRWLEQFGLEFGGVMSLLMVLGLIVLISVAIHLVLHRVVLAALASSNRSASGNRPSPNTNCSSAWRCCWGDHQHPGDAVVAERQPNPGGDRHRRAGVDPRLHPAVAVLAVGYAAGAAAPKPDFNQLLRGIFQGLKLVAAILIGIMIVSLLMGKSPLLLLSGLGAMTAVLMLVFKDPILGLVAGIQLSANDMLKIGDWLEMPKYGADGAVTDIGLTTVKVRNWDNTVTTIPTYALISDSFKTGGRCRNPAGVASSAA